MPFHDSHLVYIAKELLLLQVVQGVCMGYIVKCLFRLQSRKHNCILSLHNQHNMSFPCNILSIDSRYAYVKPAEPGCSDVSADL